MKTRIERQNSEMQMVVEREPLFIGRGIRLLDYAYATEKIAQKLGDQTDN